LNEYFVGGIKTNVSLFRRILRDPDFQAGKLDTGYLDRLLSHEVKPDLSDRDGAEVAAIAAALFAVLDPVTAVPNNGASANSVRVAAEKALNWKRAGRLEGLR